MIKIIKTIQDLNLIILSTGSILFVISMLAKLIKRKHHKSQNHDPVSPGANQPQSREVENIKHATDIFHKMED